MERLKPIGLRPRTLAEVARRASRGERFDPLLREFLDSFYGASGRDREQAIEADPERLGEVQDAYLAAVAQHLSLRHGLPTPAWTEAPHRFLRDPFFAGGMDALKAILLAESPLSFRRRGVFVSRDALSRPRDKAATSAR